MTYAEETARRHMKDLEEKRKMTRTERHIEKISYVIDMYMKAIFTYEETRTVLSDECFQYYIDMK